MVSPLTAPRLTADRIEAGRYDLPSPVVRADGSMVVWVALAYPGVREYPYGLVYTPPEVLQAEAFLTSIPGTPVIDDDGTTHAEGVSLDDPSRLGTMLDATWDEKRQAVIGRAVIDTALGLQRIQRDGKVGVSVAYPSEKTEQEGVSPDGSRYTHVETARSWADNVALTYTPRATRAHLQADSQEAPVEKEEIKAMIMEAVAAAFAAQAAADSEEEQEPEKAADKEHYTMDEAKEVIMAADALGVKLPAGLTIEAARIAIAAHVTGSREGLTADSAKLVIATARKLQADASGVWPTTQGGRAVDVDAHGIPSTAFRI